MLRNEVGGVCVYCGKEIDIDHVTIDHIIPRSHGGSNRLANLTCSCMLCNGAKMDLPINTFLQQLNDKQRSGYINRIRSLRKSGLISDEKYCRLSGEVLTEPQIISFHRRVGKLTIIGKILYG